MAAKQPEIIRDKDQMRRWSRAMRAQGKTIGLVPTMGYLHEGHFSLIREARTHADVLAISIYVNPGQFAPSEDLSTYPSDFHGDIRKLAQIPGGVDVVFNPHNLYDYGGSTDASARARNGAVESGCGETVSCLEDKGVGHETWVRVERLEKGMCGRSRPVFFRGVTTVVSKLFNIVEPDVAVFGKKDYQQWRIIQRMVRDLDFSVRVIGSEIVREHDGLAMSSRNGCGRSRPVFFRGVTTVVSKLFNIVEPDVAVFGKKDYQQWRIIQRMVRDLDFSVRVIGSEIVREHDGLAMSSRNVRLSPEEREKALSISKSLSEARSSAEKGQVNCKELRDLVIQAISEAGGRVDYAEIVDQESLESVEEIRRPVVFCVAAWFGKVRLIDNMEIDI